MSSGSKKGDKRSRVSMEESNSFVKSVTSKVSSFLPATITRWLSPSTSNSNGSAPAADATDSSTEDEAPEPVIQPPAKRMRYNPPDFNHFTPTEITCINTSVDTVDTKFTTSTQEKPNNKKSFPSKLSRSGIPVRKSIFSTTNKGSSKTTQAKSTPDDDSQQRKSAHKPMLLSSPFYPGQTMYGGASSPHLNQANIKQRRNTVVNESKSKDNTGMSLSARRIMELLENTGTPLMEAKRISQYVKNTTNSTSIHNSTPSVSPVNYTPYAPPTLSYKTQELQLPSAASIMQLKQRSRLMNTTNAARQIIASHSSTSPYVPYSMDRNRVEPVQESKNQFVTKIKTKLNGPKRPTKEPEYTYNAPLNLPTGVLQIGKNNMPTFTFTTTQPNISTSITTSSITIEPSLTEQESNISIGKDCSDPKIHEFGFKKSAISAFESTKEQDLHKPNDVNTSDPKSKDVGIHMTTPQVSNSWTINKPKLTENDNATPKPKSANNNSGSPTFETLPNNDSYKFSSPVRICNDASLSNSSSAQFTFGSPERTVVTSTKVKKNISTDFDNQLKSSKRRCSGYTSIIEAENKKCSSPPITSKDAVNKSKCSICKLVDSQTDKDKCLNCEKKTVVKESSPKWKCQDCWVENDPSVEKCVCCGASNSNKSDAIKKMASVEKGNISSTQTDWRCDICWVKNNSNVESCLACGEPKTGTKPNSSSSWAKSTVGSVNSNNTDNLLVKTMGAQSDKWSCPTCLVNNENNNSKCVCCGYEKQSSLKESSNLNNLIKTQSDKWECPSCLVRNENNKTKCVCCESEKPGTTQQSLSLKTANKAQFNNWECLSCLVKNDNNRSKCICCETERPGTTSEAAKLSFNFGINTNNTFKFGIDPKVQEMQLLKKTDVAETNNNVLPKTPSFTFGIPARKDDINTGVTKENENKEIPKMNFTFGIPRSQATETVATPLFTLNKLPEVVPNNIIQVKENPQEVPKIDFTLAKPKETLKPLPGIFGSPLNSSSNQGLSIAAPPQLIPAVTTDNANMSNPLMLQPALTSAQVTQPQNIFAFSSGLKPAVNLFAAPTTTLSFTSPVQTAATASPSSLFNKQDITAPSLFQKTETVTTSTISLFDKPSTITTATLPSMTATAPVFSFGSNGPQNAIAQPEKPKFNFTFGGVNPLFSNNNAFGASTDVTTNKFDISSGSISTGNSGLSVGGALSGSGLGTNKLGTNDLSTSHTPAVADSQTTASSLFAPPVQKDNLWLSQTSNTSNSFVSTSSTTLPKPATFTFGSTMQFNANSTPAFGGNTMMFGMNQSANNTPMFSTPVHNQTAPNLFGSPQTANNNAPSIGMFGTPNVAAAPTFGSPRPAFESSITPTPTPAFNFSASQPTSVFGMVQQPAQSQQGQQPGMYNFAVPSGGAPQFNIGSAPNTGVRRLRKAVRRNNPR